MVGLAYTPTQRGSYRGGGQGPQASPTDVLAATRLAALRLLERKALAEKAKVSERIDEWAERRFFVREIGVPIVLEPHQKQFLRLAFTRDAAGYFPFKTIIYSTIKKSGKTAISGLVGRWWSETQRRNANIYCCGNDAEQAKDRAFKAMVDSLKLDPNWDAHREAIPGEWETLKTSMSCLLTGARVQAIAVDAKGEAGGEPDLTLWTELWGYEHEDARKFWDEMTPVPTLPDSIRYVETYAGFETGSELLMGLYTLGKEGRQLTAGELADATGVPWEGAWQECTSPDDYVPLWINETASVLMYWDEGDVARRMPWQKGERGEEYYRAQENTLLPSAYRRLHKNEWVSAEGSFITREMWDGCKEAIPPLPIGDRTPVVIGVDAASTRDCFAIVMVTRHPDPGRHEHLAVRGVKVWNPNETGKVDYDEAERFLRFAAQGGHIDTTKGYPELHPKTPRETSLFPECERCTAGRNGDPGAWDVPGYNVLQICYDPAQLDQLSGRLRKDHVSWIEPFVQGADRTKADRGLYDLVLNREIVHSGEPTLTQHILNCMAKLQKDQDSTLRLVKASANRKIDAAVALSMAASRCLYLRL